MTDVRYAARTASVSTGDRVRGIPGDHLELVGRCHGPAAPVDEGGRVVTPPQQQRLGPVGTEATAEASSSLRRGRQRIGCWVCGAPGWTHEPDCERLRPLVPSPRCDRPCQSWSWERLDAEHACPCAVLDEAGVPDGGLP